MAQPPDSILDELARMVLAGDQRRATASEQFLNSLTIHELVLVCESAVSGYLAGVLYGTTNSFHRVDVPRDPDIRAAAFTRCRIEPGRFPHIGTVNVVSSAVFYDSMDPRNQWLVSEAMVMGFILGYRYRSVRQEETTLPDDEAIVHTVVQHCQSTSDIYPVVGENVREVIWKIVKNNPGRARTGAVAETVEMLLPGRRDDAAATIAEMLDEETLIDTTNGLEAGPAA